MDDPPYRKPTSFDVANLAGVSRSAVSRAFAPGANISPETRKKVLDAAKALGYRVNTLARSLQQGDSALVGLVASRLDTPIRSRQVRLLSEALIREGYRPMLLTAERPGDVAGLIDSLIGFNVAGMIITSDTPPRELIEDCGRQGLPVVLINRAETANWGDRVVADIETGGRLAFEMLTGCGATRLGCVAPRKVTYSVTGRAEAFRRRAAAAGLPCTMLETGDQSYGDARSTIAATPRDELERIDGLFCTTDLIALGALDALRLDHGLRVPEDIQVIGFDDIDQASWGAYDLSTVRQDLDEQTAATMRLLKERMERTDTPLRTHNEALIPIYRSTTRKMEDSTLGQATD